MWQQLSGLGHLTRNPELRFTPNTGTAIASAGIAFNRRFKHGEELKEEVCFLDLICFGKSGEHLAQYCAKGDPVLVSGRLQQRRWEDANGTKHSKHELVVEMWKTLKKREGPGPDVES